MTSIPWFRPPPIPVMAWVHWLPCSSNGVKRPSPTDCPTPTNCKQLLWRSEAEQCYSLRDWERLVDRECRWAKLDKVTKFSLSSRWKPLVVWVQPSMLFSSTDIYASVIVLLLLGKKVRSSLKFVVFSCPNRIKSCVFAWVTSFHLSRPALTKVCLHLESISKLQTSQSSSWYQDRG